MDFSDEHKIKLHLEKVEQLRQESNKNILKLEDLKELNMGIGVTEFEWNEMLEKAAESLELAKNHLAHNNFQDAAEAAEKAVGLNPFIAQGNSIRAKAALHLWLLDNDENLKRKAEMLAKDALQIDPKDAIALKVLKMLRQRSRTQKSLTESNKKNVIAIAVGLIMSILILFFVFGPSAELNNQELDVAAEKTEQLFANYKSMCARKNNLFQEFYILNKTDSKTIQEVQSILNQQKDPDIDKALWIDLQIQLNAKLMEMVSDMNDMEISKEKLEMLLIQLEGSENRITFSKNEYNEAVRNFNNLLNQSKNNSTEYIKLNYLN